MVSRPAESPSTPVWSLSVARAKLSEVRSFMKTLPILNTGKIKIRLMTVQPPVVASYGNSPAVFAFVQGLVEAGRAQCIIGNHELNLLRNSRKKGNGWF